MYGSEPLVTAYVIQYYKIMDIFKLYHPQPVDMLKSEYNADKDNIDKLAKDNGYYFKGYVDNQAVFSTKPN